jgi:Protein tyrosine and serine/threonine kinase
LQEIVGDCIAGGGKSRSLVVGRPAAASPFDDDDDDDSEDSDSNDDHHPHTFLNDTLTDGQISQLETKPATSVSLYDTLNFSNEADRLAALRKCSMLDTAPESRFDAITELIGKSFNVPVALVSLLSKDLWLKSSFGPVKGCLEREGSFCSYITVNTYHQVLVVPDATKDARFVMNPFVSGPPYMRFYGGAPLVTSSGHRIGTLCMVDFEPRNFPASAYQLLLNFAEIIVREIERDALAESIPETLLPAAYEPVALLTASDAGWPFVYLNEAMKIIVPGAEVSDHASVSFSINGGANYSRPLFWDVFQPSDPEVDLEALKKEVNDGNAPVALHVHRTCDQTLDGKQRPSYLVNFRLASRDCLENSACVSIPGFVTDEGTESFPALELGTLWLATLKIINPEKPPPTTSTAGISNKQRNATFALREKALMTGLNYLGRKPAKWPGLQLAPLLGEGAYGKVYRGNLNGTPVAVKVIEVAANLIGSNNDLHSLSKNDTKKSDSAVLEAILSRKLSHPSIIPILSYAMVPGKSLKSPMEVWICQYLCDRGTLYDLLDRGMMREHLSLDSPASLSTVLSTAHDIASAMQYIHERGYIHGDLSGNNIMFSSAPNDDRGFKALVGDFGLARELNGNALHPSGGTISHMPPEILSGSGELTQAVDIWSFGIILHELWVGKRAWAGMRHVAIIYQITQLEKRLLLPEDCVSEPLRQLCAACQAIDPAQRPGFDEILNRLEEMKALV